jgi:CheY-like chemotaxis protein
LTPTCVLSIPFYLFSDGKGGSINPTENPGLILLAEDDPNDVFLVERALREAGITHRLAVVHNGQEVLKYLTGERQGLLGQPGPLPTLLLLDLDMPLMNGFEVLSWLRRQPKFDRLPIVVFTGSTLSPDVSRAYRLGANSFVTKPAEIEQLKAALKEIIQFWGAKPGQDQDNSGTIQALH